MEAPVELNRERVYWITATDDCGKEKKIKLVEKVKRH